MEDALRLSLRKGHDSAQHVAEHLGHTLLDPPQLSRFLAAQETLNVGDDVVRVDRVRHRLACHGDRHARKHVQEMARPLIQDWMEDFEAEKSTRQPVTGAMETVEMVDYYRHKMPDSQLLLDPHPEVVICKTTQKNLQALATFVKEKTEEFGPCGYDKKLKCYRPMIQLNEKKMATKVSFKPKGTGVCYEFSTKSL